MERIEFTSSDSDEVAVIKDFGAMGLSDDLERGMFAYGWEKPSAIQQRFVRVALEGRDVIAQAQSGTGKSSSLALVGVGVAEKSVKKGCEKETTDRSPVVLVLCPTRELAAQLHRVSLALAAFTPVRSLCCTGGTSMHEDVRKLDFGHQLVVGTPGRIFGNFVLLRMTTERLTVFDIS